MVFCGAISGKLSEFEKTVSLTNILQKTNEFKDDCKQNDEFVHNDSFYVNAVMLTAEKKGVRMGGGCCLEQDVGNYSLQKHNIWKCKKSCNNSRMGKFCLPP